MSQINKKKRLIGSCVWCSKPVYDNQLWEATDYELPKIVKPHLPIGVVHKRCRVPMFKRFIKDISKDLSALEWLYQILMKDKNGNK